MSAGVGLIVMAAIFAFGVALFGVAMIVILPGATFLEDRLAALRARRTPPPAAPEPPPAAE
jgi:hypothetical protein